MFCTSHSEKECVDRVKKITNYGYVLKNSGEFVLIESINMAFSLFESNRRLKEENEKRKKIEAALREEEEELSAIYEHTPVLMIIVDRERRVRRANAFATEFAGSPAEKLIGKRVGEALRCVHHLDDPKGCGFGPFCEQCKVRRTVTASFDKQKSFKKLESTLPFIKNRSAKETTFLISTSYLEIKEEPLVIVSIEDITERKKFEEDLKRSEEKFRILFNLTPDAALLADAETGQIVKANNSAEDLFEIPLDNLIGMNHAELYSEELRQKADVEFKKGPELLSKPFPPLEMIIETPSGIKKTVELRASAFHLDNKLHLLGTFQDITEGKRA